MLCAQLVIFLRPKAAYEKYLKVFVSLFFLIQFILCADYFFKNMDEERMLERVRYYSENMLEASLYQVEPDKQEDMVQEIEPITVEVNVEWE